MYVYVCSYAYSISRALLACALARVIIKFYFYLLWPYVHITRNFYNTVLIIYVVSLIKINHSVYLYLEYLSLVFIFQVLLTADWLTTADPLLLHTDSTGA